MYQRYTERHTVFKHKYEVFLIQNPRSLLIFSNYTPPKLNEEGKSN